MNEKTTVITNTKIWMEYTALKQLDALADLEGVVQVVGLPDLHAGKTPVGVTLVTEGIIYPHIIGGDIGCGMSFYETSMEKKKLKLDRWTERLQPYRDLADFVIDNPYQETSPVFDLGSIGGGNHFAEFQLIHEVVDRALLQSLQLDENAVYLLIHSGSRSYGNSILSQCPSGACGDNEAYMEKHDDALKWAGRNRDMVADKMMGILGYKPALRKVIDCNHNFLEERKGLYFHRKGAVSSEKGPVVIPGSRGSLTYLVMPKSNLVGAAFSLSHGAGRKWARSLCKSRVNSKYDRVTIRQNQYKGRVVCHDANLLFEEAPEAYKNIDAVIQCLLEHDMIDIIATCKPMLTYKG